MSTTTPVKVDISVESLDTNRDAFYNLCFITENNEAPRTLVISNLKELLDNGYTRDSLAYNFCVGVFSQQAMPIIYIRAKRFSESYEDAFLADSNREFYFIIIESKDIFTISSFSSFMATQDNQKMLFYSNSLDTKLSNKSVGYYQDFSLSGSLDINNSNYYVDKSYGANYSDKYASHPYAFYAQENTQTEMVINSIGVERVLVELFLNEPIDYSLAVTDARLVQVYFEPRLIPNIALNSYSVNLGFNPPPLGSEVLLKQVYFPPTIVQAVGTERMNLSVQATGVLLRAWYIPLKYTHYATQDDYYTNKLAVNSVNLRKII